MTALLYSEGLIPKRVLKMVWKVRLEEKPASIQMLSMVYSGCFQGGTRFFKTLLRKIGSKIAIPGWFFSKRITRRWERPKVSATVFRSMSGCRYNAVSSIFESSHASSCASSIFIGCSTEEISCLIWSTGVSNSCWVRLVFLSTTVRVVRTSSTITTIIAKKARSRDKKMIVDVAFVIVYDGLIKVKNPSGFIQNVLWPN